MIRVLITGKLHDTPQERESANGNTYALAKVKADDKGGAW
ncbi:MAG: single-stranded DNA-binding protein, partial [Phycisphaerales bacterium]|nr:single-stranded DNA-binding protein [Phycisphaerales bacterium]